MKYIARRLLNLLAAVVVGALLGGLVGLIFMDGGFWGENVIFGGIGGVIVGLLYDPRAATYTVPTSGGAKYPGNRDD